MASKGVTGAFFVSGKDKDLLFVELRGGGNIAAENKAVRKQESNLRMKRR
jgi:hypothetical protein